MTEVEADFDISDSEDIESAEYVLKDPVTGNSTKTVLILAGPEHANRRKLRMAAARRMQRALEKTGRMSLRDPEEQEEDETEMLVVSTLGWRGMVRSGAPLAFSRDAAYEVYMDPKRRWLREQVKLALEERERFIKRSAAS